MSCKRTFSNRHYLLAVLFIGLTGISHLKAQQRVRVELWDHSLYEGPIYQSIDSIGVHVLIEGSEVLIPHNRIENIQFIHGKKPRSLREKSYVEIEKGYYHTFGVGASFGNATPGMSLSLVNGYQWGRFIGTGLGIGYEFMDDISTFPLFLEVKGYLQKGKIIPYYFVRPGYGFLNSATTFEQNTSEKGGIYWFAGVGYQFNFSVSSMGISIGHLGQDATVSYTYPDWWSGEDNHVTEKRMKRRIAVRIEFIF